MNYNIYIHTYVISHLMLYIYIYICVHICAYLCISTQVRSCPGAAKDTVRKELRSLLREQQVAPSELQATLANVLESALDQGRNGGFSWFSWQRCRICVDLWHWSSKTSYGISMDFIINGDLKQKKWISAAKIVCQEPWKSGFKHQKWRKIEVSASKNEI